MRFVRHGLALFLLLLVPSASALHASDVGVIDWHKHLVGVPLVGAVSTAPVFHLVGTKSILLTATGNNVLAALNPEDGSVVWRYIYEREEKVAGFYKHENVVASLSGPGGSTLRTFEALTGHLILEKRLHSLESGHLSEPHHLGKFVAFSPGLTRTPDMFVLSNGHTINHIDGSTGEIKWSWSSPDNTSLIIHSKVIATRDAIYAIGVAKSFASFTLHVTSLSPATGEVLATANIPSSIAEALTEFLPLSHVNQSATSAPPHVVWLEQGSIKSVPLTVTLRGKTITVKGSMYRQIVDVGLSDQGHLVAVKMDGSSRVLRLQSDGSALKSVWEFKGSSSSEDKAESVFTGGLDIYGHTCVSRVYWSHSLRKAVVTVFPGHLTDSNATTEFDFPFDTLTHGIIGHVAMDLTTTANLTNAVARMFITTSTGAAQLWQQSDLRWTREESLAALIVAEFVELPERILTWSSGDGEETFYTRVLRQISDAQNFPQYLVNFARRFATGSYASASSSATVPADNGPLSRDTFGFRQVIVAATAFGKVYGIDSSNGEILWNRVLGLGWAGEVGARIQPVKLFVTRTVSDGAVPQVVLITQRTAKNGLVDTVIFHIDALTGGDARDSSKGNGDIFEGLDIIEGPLVEAYMLENELKSVLLLDEHLQVYLYPDTIEHKDNFNRIANAVHFPLRTNSPTGQRRLVGHQVAYNPAVSDKFVGYPTWTLSLPAEEDVQSIIPAARGPVASIGKVLGNRTTLYKYLNPRLFIVLTVTRSVSSTCGIYLVDGVKGSIVYHAKLPSNVGTCDVKVSLTENWLVYHYYDEEYSAVGQAKGYRMVTVELYEGQGIDLKTKSSDMSSYSLESINITAFEQSYVLPYAITAMAPTATKFGITSKDLIVASRHHQIQSFQRRLLNPRRPKRKTTTEEQEEFLVSYDPILPYDTRRVLSHNYEVANIRRIITAPAFLESTSLVFAYGLDLFLTRAAPSNTFDVLNENFNKAQLVLTVSGLALAIIITKPMVQRKRLRERWYQ